MKLFNLNKHERDDAIKFYKEPHIYEVNGEKMDKSVTKLVHDCFPEFDKNAVSKKIHKSHFENKKSQYYQMTQEEILDKWEKNKNEACELGTFLHESIELYYNDIQCENNSVEYTFFENFKNEFYTLIPYRTEWEIYYEEKSIAGSVDMVFKNPDNTYSIYDWKRSKTIAKSNHFEFGKGDFDHLPNCNFWHYSLQLNIYKYILELKYNFPIKDLFLVVMHPNNTNYIRLECPNLQNEVICLISKISPKEKSVCIV